MAAGFDLPPLRDTDSLGRRVYSGRRAQRWAQGRADHELFLVAKGAPSLSVDRLDHVSDRIMTAIADAAAAARTGPFRGWGVVTVEHATQTGCAVEATPRLENPYHADIVVNVLDSAEQRDAEKARALELVVGAKWRGRP